MRNAQRGSIPIPWSLPIECHQGLVELAQCRSDPFSASSVSRRARNSLTIVFGYCFDSATGWNRAWRHGLLAHMPRVKCLAPREHGPQDASILVGQRHHGLSPATALAQSQRPLRDRITAAMRRHHGRFRALDEQCSQIGVAAFGDAAQVVLAPAGSLTRHQAGTFSRRPRTQRPHSPRPQVTIAQCVKEQESKCPPVDP